MKKIITTVTLACLLIIAGLPACLAAQLLPTYRIVEPLKLPVIVPAPSQLTATADGTSVNLTWQDNSANETVFDIERRDDEGSFSSIATARSGNTSYMDSGLNSNTRYTYRVRAMTSSAFSSYSNEAAVTTGSALINSPNLQIKPDIKIPADKLTYDYKIYDGSATITKYKGLGGDVTIPSTLGGAKVTRIDTLAFEYCSDVTSIIVPDTVTSIGMDTFRGCKKLKKITLPNGITSIGLDAFAECSGLSSINLPTSLKTLELGTFNGCSNLTEIVIPSGVTTMKADVFLNCTGLSQVVIPPGMVEIAPSSFYGCSKLTSINVADGNPAFTNIDGILYSKDKSALLIYPPGKVAAAITIPGQVKTIGPCAFAGLSYLKSVIIPISVTNIGNSAFRGTGLTSITIPAAVQKIGFNVFEKCGSLTSVKISGTLTNIESETFKGCTSLTAVSMVNGVQTIGTNAFHGCTSLKGIYMPSTIKSIKKGAFQGCPALRSIWFYGYPPNIDWDAVDYKTDVADDVTHHYTEVTLYYPRALEDQWLYDWNSWGWDTAPFDTLQSNLQELYPHIVLKDVALTGQQTSAGEPASTKYPGPLPDGSTSIQLYLGKSGFGVNGQSFDMDTTPILVENRLLLPVRYVAEPLGAAAVWDQQEQKVTVTLDQTIIELWIGRNAATINGANAMIDPHNPKVKPIIVPPGRTMLPLRFLAEALGCEVVWDQKSQQVILTKKK